MRWGPRSCMTGIQGGARSVRIGSQRGWQLWLRDHERPQETICGTPLQNIGADETAVVSCGSFEFSHGDVQVKANQIELPTILLVVSLRSDRTAYFTSSVSEVVNLKVRERQVTGVW